MPLVTGGHKGQKHPTTSSRTCRTTRASLPLFGKQPRGCGVYSSSHGRSCNRFPQHFHEYPRTPSGLCTSSPPHLPRPSLPGKASLRSSSIQNRRGRSNNNMTLFGLLHRRVQDRLRVSHLPRRSYKRCQSLVSAYPTIRSDPPGRLFKAETTGVEGIFPVASRGALSRLFRA